MDIDPDIQAAFSGAQSGTSPSSNIDPDIQAAFGSHPSLISGIGTQLGHAGLDILGGIAHGAGTLADVVTGRSPGAGSYAEKFASPFSHAPDEEGPPDVKEQIRRAAPKLGDQPFMQGPLGQTFQERVPQALEAIGAAQGVGGFAEGGVNLLRGTRAASAIDNPQSISAAAASPNISAASPELRGAAENAVKGGPINRDAMARHLEADSLPVRVKLTEGQATQNPNILSAEQNARGKHPQLAARFNEQNSQLVQNVQALRDEVGPDVFTTNPTEHGDTLIQAYKDKAAAADADINSKYQALRDANGGEFPVDANKLLSNVRTSLKKQLLTNHAPSAEMGELTRMADEGMNFEDFESLRTNLARVSRSSQDGNVRAAAGIMREQMEQLPLSGGAEGLKPLADAARTAARTQFQALDADPAYKAAVNDSVSPDRFVQKFLIGGDRDNVALMRKNLQDNAPATQTMGVAALDHLRRTAGIDEMGNGNFSQANFNKNLQALGPKLGSLVDPKTADALERVGNVARYTQAQPRGSFVNNSNTAVSQAAEYAKGGLEALANAKTGGIGGTIVRKTLQRRSENKAVERALAPGAGISSSD